MTLCRSILIQVLLIYEQDGWLGIASTHALAPTLLFLPRHLLMIICNLFSATQKGLEYLLLFARLIWLLMTLIIHGKPLNAGFQGPFLRSPQNAFPITPVSPHKRNMMLMLVVSYTAKATEKRLIHDHIFHGLFPMFAPKEIRELLPSTYSDLHHRLYVLHRVNCRAVDL